MILNRPGAEFTYKGVKYVIGEEVVGTDQSEYRNLIGCITEIRDGEDKETENDTPDIYCAFEPPAAPYDIAELEETFSELYGQRKNLDDICLDMVIMAPEMIAPIRLFAPEDVILYTVDEEWDFEDGGGSSFSVYADYLAAKAEYAKLIAKRLNEEPLSTHASDNSWGADSCNDYYECGWNDKAGSWYYRIGIHTHYVIGSLCSPPAFDDDTAEGNEV